MNNEEIKDLIKLVSKLGLGKVEIEKDGFKINIKGPNLVSPGVYMAPPVAAPVPASVPASAPASPAAEPTASTPSESASTITIKSSMIGTFYRSSSPDKPPFAEVGTEIKKGDKICIIEAMKLFNEIESEVSGRIVKVLVDDATPVEFDQPLFLVEPA
ncbi:MAG: acetyl-CoA carboxylase biotin carboxyl carrier protein [Crocinitomicaceae bacterium]|jgi:acetyl-CoA carboxylase biotin carboxyl carrier protein|nr:acetyl-CoA carboxylase biotin carboxyl carrier protein [Crocinitomicaceae bacterium]